MVVVVVAVVVELLKAREPSGEGAVSVIGYLIMRMLWRWWNVK